MAPYFNSIIWSTMKNLELKGLNNIDTVLH